VTGDVRELKFERRELGNPATCPNCKRRVSAMWFVPAPDNRVICCDECAGIMAVDGSEGFVYMYVEPVR
jgi:hypothetical protein